MRCTENSPERRGEEGCSILVTRPLVASTTKPTYWHIDRFDSLEAAAKAAGPDGVPAEAHGSYWLMTVESRTEEHSGGRHVAWIGPLALPDAGGHTMRVQSSLLRPGTTTPVHTHSGPEVFYIVAGEQCLETPEVGQRLNAGQSHVLPAPAPSIVDGSSGPAFGGPWRSSCTTPHVPRATTSTIRRRWLRVSSAAQQ